MKKITLKVSMIYAVYKQLPFIFLAFCSSIAFFYFVDRKVLIGFLLYSLLLRVVYGIYYYKKMSFEIYADRINVTKGVFTHDKSFLELYRIKDFKEQQSFFMKIFNLMTISLITSDKTDPIVLIEGIEKSDILTLIRYNVELQRKLKGVREFD